jgi:hypothetical protein
MEFTMTVDVTESDIIEAMDINGLTREEAIWRISNNLYMGLSCIDAMLHRDLGIESTESFVHKSADAEYGDHSPSEKDFPIEVIEHQAEMHDLPCSDTLIQFAKACWAECAWKNNIKTN